MNGSLKIFENPVRSKPTDRDYFPFRFHTGLQTGLDAMVEDNFALLEGRRFALLTNATGLDSNLDPGVEKMIAAGFRPELVFEPEHGLYGHVDRVLPDGIRIESERGLAVLSLYGNLRKPQPHHLEGLDLIVVDFFNLPVRCYTYISTLTYVLEAAAENNLEVLILDRPHPYGHMPVAGSYLRENFESFVALAPVPFLYNMTVAEYAIYLKKLRFPELRISVIPLFGFEPGSLSLSGAAWINPSPNIPSLESALVYPGMVLFEGVNVSLGRGTTRPFSVSGAPWMNARWVLEELRSLNLPGVEFSRAVFEPSASVYAHRTNHGIHIHPISRDFDPLEVGYEYLRILQHLHGDQLRFRYARGRPFMDSLWGGPGYREALQADLTYEQFKNTWQEDAMHFAQIIEDIRLYR